MTPQRPLLGSRQGSSKVSRSSYAHNLFICVHQKATCGGAVLGVLSNSPESIIGPRAPLKVRVVLQLGRGPNTYYIWLCCPSYPWLSKGCRPSALYNFRRLAQVSSFEVGDLVTSSMSINCKWNGSGYIQTVEDSIPQGLCLYVLVWAVFGFLSLRFLLVRKAPILRASNRTCIFQRTPSLKPIRLELVIKLMCHTHLTRRALRKHTLDSKLWLCKRAFSLHFHE